LIERHQSANRDEDESIVGHCNSQRFSVFLALSIEVAAGHAAGHTRTVAFTEATTGRRPLEATTSGHAA
jgi:hypothetical protein